MKNFIKNKKNLFIISTIIILVVSVFIKFNYYKFYSIYFIKKWELTKNLIEKKNLKTIEHLNQNKIYFENKEYNFINFPLEKYGISYFKDYSHKPLGYIDIYKDRIIFASYDGKIFYSNNIDEIKKKNLILNKFEIFNYNFDFDFEDGLHYRNIKIRDILVDGEDLYVVTNGRTKIDEDNYYASTNILKGKINLNDSKIYFNSFFSPDEKITDIVDWSHTGGRLVKYKNSSFLLSVPDYALMNDYKKLTKLVNSKKSIIGKILLVEDAKFKIFSYGHRNPQGLYYDDKNDLIFETEHGPTGGDEINLIKKNKNYGWPEATYGATIEGLNFFRNHKKNGYVEPLSYWWPRGCGVSQIIKVDNNFNDDWKNYTIINACLSGSKDQGKSIYRWEFDIKKETLIKKNKYHIGDRIRDIKYLKSKKTIMMLLENKRSLALIFK